MFEYFKRLLLYQIIAPFLLGQRLPSSLPASTTQVRQFVVETSPQHWAKPFAWSWPCSVEPSPKPVEGTLIDKRLRKPFKFVP